VKEKRAFGVSHPKRIVIHLWIDVTVGHEQVFPSIIVKVEELNSEAKERYTHGPDPSDARQVGKLAVSVIAIQVVGVVRKIGLYYVGPAVMIIVGGVDSHSRSFPPIGVVGQAGTNAHFFEISVAIIMVEKAWSRVVGYVKVEASVFVVVEPKHSEAVVAIGIDVQLFRDVGERPVPIVVKETIPRALKASRTAGHGYSAILTEWIATQLREMIEVKINVVRDV
jgi:hypothetical protein